MRVAVLTLFALGCGGAGQTAPAQPVNDKSQQDQVAPTQASADASAPTATAEEDSVVRSYAIDGATVDKATFDALFSRLDVDETPFEGETVVNPDGSYGGAGEMFHASEGDAKYRYEFHTYPVDEDRVGESYMLIRETAAP